VIVIVRKPRTPPPTPGLTGEEFASHTRDQQARLNVVARIKVTDTTLRERLIAVTAKLDRAIYDAMTLGVAPETLAKVTGMSAQQVRAARRRVRDAGAS
jgi:hypothetical protein